MIFRNFIWDFLGRIGGQLVSFIISIVLTRLLDPAEYGLMGMAIVVITIAGVFLDLGFRQALVQKADVGQKEYTSVFYVVLTISLLLMLTCFLLAHPLALFYKQPQVEPLIKATSLIFLLNALSLVPATLLYKSLNFKAISVFTLISAIVSGVLGIIMAYKGFGVWSLVAQSLSNTFILFVLYALRARWLPGVYFSVSSLKGLWGYASRLLAIAFIDNVFTRIDIFIIGKLFNAHTLGFYGRAQALDHFTRQISSNSFLSVLFPHIARLQNDRITLLGLYIRYLHIISFVGVGLSGLLFVVAKDLFIFLFTAKWLPAAELFQIMALGGFVYPVAALMGNLITGVGNAQGYLRLEMIKKTLLLLVFVFGFLWGIKIYLWVLLGFSVVGLVMNAHFVCKEIEINLSRQLKVVFTYVVINAVAIAAVQVLGMYIDHLTIVVKLALLSLAFAGVFTGINILVATEGFTSIWDKVRWMNLPVRLRKAVNA